MHARRSRARRRRPRRAPSPRRSERASAAPACSSRQPHVFHRARRRRRCCRDVGCRPARCGWTCCCYSSAPGAAIAAAGLCLSRSLSTRSPHAAMVNIAVRAARRAGDIIVRDMNRVPIARACAQKGRNDFVTEIDQPAEARHHRDDPRARIPITRSSPRKAAPQRRRRVRLDHRSARRHHEFPARLSAVRGVDRRAAPRPARARRRLRSACARSCSRRRAATARSSTASASASASASTWKAR